MSKGETIVITSGKGGVGKTTVAAYLGAKLAAKGKRTIVCDLDFGLNNLDIVMGVEDKISFDLTDALEGRCRASQALVECGMKNLYMISSANAAGGEAMVGTNIKMLFEGLKQNFDYVLLDCPAGIDVGFHRAVHAADSAIVVITPSLSSVRDADKVLSVLRTYDLNKISVVVNMARGDLMVEKSMLTASEIEALLKTRVIGIIPYDDLILTNDNCILPDYLPVGQSFKRLAAYIIGKKLKLNDPEKEYTGIKGSIKRKIKKMV